MKNPQLAILCLVSLFLCSLELSAQNPVQPDPSTYKDSSGDVIVRFPSYIGRSYMTQTSENLSDWYYLPSITAGTGNLIEQAFTPTNFDKLFIRIRWSDIPTSTPETADFDMDGISNIDELNNGADPLLSSSDSLADPPDLLDSSDEDIALANTSSTTEFIVYTEIN